MEAKEGKLSGPAIMEATAPSTAPEYQGPVKFLLLFDFEQTLFNNVEAKEVVFEKQGAAYFKAIIEKLITPCLREKIGLVSVPIEKIKSAMQDWEAKFVNKYKAQRENTLKLKNTSYIGDEITMDSELFTLIGKEDCFDSGAKVKPENEKALKDFCLSIVNQEGCFIQKYEPFEKVGEVLADLKKDGVAMAICTNNVTPKAMKVALDTYHFTSFFSKIIISGEVGLRLPNPGIINFAKKEFPEYKDFEIGIVGDMLDRDILAGKNSNIRTLWCVKKPMDPALNYSKLKDIKPDFIFSQFRQLPSIVRMMAKDAEFIAKNGIPCTDYYKPDIYKLLTSNKALRCAYYFPKKKDGEMAEKGVTHSNEKVVYVPLMIDCDFEVQGPFDGFVHKVADLMIEEFQKNKNKKFTELQTYLEKNQSKIVSVDPLSQVKATLLRTTTNDMIEKGLQDPKLVEIMKQYNIQIKLPYSRVFINTDPKETTKAILEDISAKKADFPFFIKLAESCQTVESHTLAVCMNAKGLEEGLGINVYKGQNLIVQQFVKHYATVFKIFTIGNYITYHFKKSLPSEMPIENYGIFDSQKPFPKEWITNAPEPKDRINREFMKEATIAFINAINMSLLGVDYIIEESSGNYYLIDLNYFSSYRHEKYLSKLFSDHIVHLHDKFIKGKKD